MKKRIFLILVLCVAFSYLKAQIKKDTLSSEDTLYVAYPSTNSNFGNYFSGGIGVGYDYGLTSAIYLLSYSLAYKNVVFSFTAAGANALTYYESQKKRYLTYNSGYFGVLAGKSKRTRNGMMSISAGLAYTGIFIGTADNSQYPSQPEPPIFDKSGFLSIPIEFKYFFLGYNFWGVGLHLSVDLVLPNMACSPFYLGISTVSGKWNKRHHFIFPSERRRIGRFGV